MKISGERNQATSKIATKIMVVCTSASVTEQSNMTTINVMHLQQSTFQSGDNEMLQKMTLERPE